MPWREMVKICKRQGVWSVVDAAHSIGQEVGLDLTSAEPDFWLSVCNHLSSFQDTLQTVVLPPTRIVTSGSLQRGLAQCSMFPRGEAYLARRM
jgi:hypothetical protein